MDNSNLNYDDSLFVSIQRIERNRLLNETDKYLISDYPITSNNLILIKQYRQELRDYMDNSYFTSNIGFPFPPFPEMPF